MVLLRTRYSSTLGMLYLAHEEIFENMLQLKYFGLYFEIILNKKWLLSYRNNDISCTHARGLWGIIHEHGRPQEFFQGGANLWGGPLKICEGGPPYFFRQALKYAYRGGGGVVFF